MTRDGETVTGGAADGEAATGGAADGAATTCDAFHLKMKVLFVSVDLSYCVFV